MLGFDTVCMLYQDEPRFSYICCILTITYIDHLMFDVDPETVKTGVESEVMQYMRAWKLIYIYVSFLYSRLHYTG